MTGDLTLLSVLCHSSQTKRECLKTELSVCTLNASIGRPNPEFARKKIAFRDRTQHLHCQRGRLQTEHDCSQSELSVRRPK